jgi:hypothetical protein
MIPSSWKHRRDREVCRSRSGGVDSIIADLLDVSALIHIESSRWPDYRAVDLYMSAWQIQVVAISYARRDTDRHTAEMWIESGRAYLQSIQRARVEKESVE